jgi:Ca-activated chloride channel family protein
MPPELVTGFHFAQPGWLWLLPIPLLLWLTPPGKKARKEMQKRMRQYADPHLLPHLLVPAQEDEGRQRYRLLLWSLLWWLGVLAMAGPRWDYTDVNVFQPGSDLVILFDLSRSMEVSDVRPSRLARARQEVEDLLNQNPGMRIGMIAFATVAHVVAPITEDTHTLRHLLPSLSTALLQLQGSRFAGALDRADRLLSGQPPGNSRAILLISDGDFDEPGLEDYVRRLRAQGIKLYILGVGTPQGGPVPGPRGWLEDRQGQRVVSRLEEDTLKRLATAGGGFYQQADFRDEDTKTLLAKLQSDAPVQLQENPIRVWHERYFLLVLLMMIFLLSRFRRGISALRR